MSRQWTMEDSERVWKWSLAHRPDLASRYQAARNLFWEVNGFKRELRDEKRVGASAEKVWREMCEAWQDAGEDSL
jgi:gamma-glutamyl:cysteine ligase YbdK (ATP-grasp superfamily)